MTGCAAFGCKNKSQDGFAMKYFPKDPARRALWAVKVRRKGWKPTNSSALCEVHFEEDQWEKDRVDGKKKLKSTAVPTIFCFAPKPKPKRKPPKKRNLDNVDEVAITEAKKVKLHHNYINPSLSEPPKLCLQEEDTASVDSVEVQSVEITPKTHSVEDALIKDASTNKVCADKMVQMLQAKLRLKEQQIRKLRLRNKDLLRKLANERMKQKNISKGISKVFNQNQVAALGVKSTRGFVWSNETVKKALELRFACGSSGYEEILKQKLPYPSLRTLRRKLQHISFHSGLLEEVFELLQYKVKKMNEHEKECALFLDEMSIVEGLNYDVASKTFLGHVSLPDHTGMASHILVFMLGGISSRWKQVVGYYFTGKSVDGTVYKNIVLQIIHKAEALGLRVNSVTSDMGASNLAMWKAFGIACFKQAVECSNNSIVHPCDPHRQLYFLADIPHLLKNIKAALLNNKVFTFPSDIKEKFSLPTSDVKLSHVEQLAVFQEEKDLKLAPHLTLADLKNIGHFDKMKVSKAVNIFSHDTAAGLDYLVERESFSKEIQTTAWFIKLVARWFVLMTSRHPVLALSKLNLTKYEEAKTLLIEIIDIFGKIHIGEKGSWKPCQTGVILATKSILELQEYLLTERNFVFLLTSRFSQDCLENLFSCIRRVQPIPNALQAKQSLKQICVAQYLHSVPSSSYNDDDREFMDGLLELKKLKCVEEVAIPIELTEGWDGSVQDLKEAEKNSLYYVAGYIVSRIKNQDKVCDACLGAVTSSQSLERGFTTLTLLKEYKCGSLVSVTEECFLFFLEMEKNIRLFRSDILNNKKGVMQEISKRVESYKFPACHDIKSKMLSRFTQFRYKTLGSFQNAQIKKQKLKACTKSSKSQAMRELAKSVH